LENHENAHSLLAFLKHYLRVWLQKYRLNWGDEIKIKNGTTDLDIVSAGNTSLYINESRLKMKSYFVIGATYGSAQKLITFDKNYGDHDPKIHRR
jgi:hypothetical protein